MIVSASLLVFAVGNSTGASAGKKFGPGTPGGQVTTRILRSNANGMKVRVVLPRPRLVQRRRDGRLWTQLILPGINSPAAPGKPEIPVASNVLAVPEGASLIVEPGKTRSYTLDKVNLFPAQPDPVDAVSKPPDFGKPPFVARPFAWNRKAYRRSGMRPSRPADGEVLGRARDLRIAGLRVPTAQYDARRHRLRVLTSVEVKVLFKGGTHTFSDKLASPWEQSQRRIASGLLNANAVTSHAPFASQHCGAELLVVLNPAMMDTLRDLGAGILSLRTSIVETGNGPGQIGVTPAAIRDYIRARLNDPHCIHPSYVMLIGNDDLVPTFKGIDGIPSDLPYSLGNDADLLPDVAIGRILGDDQREIEGALTKIQSYVSGPGGPYRHQAIVAAPFGERGQANRAFAEFAQTVSSGLAKSGTGVDRIGRKGGRARLSAAWGSGRFLVVHRGDGWSGGWDAPRFTTHDVAALENRDLLPFVISVDCSTGAFDHAKSSFAQSALANPAGGAVGVFANTRNSPAWHNSQLGLGLVSALLPATLPGQIDAEKQRPGEALISAKLRLAALSPPTRDRDTRKELFLWHFFGDPAMQMLGGGKPLVLDSSQISATFIKEPPPSQGNAPPFAVLVTLPAELNGETVSLDSTKGGVIGKAIVRNGVAMIPADFSGASVRPSEFNVIIDAENARLLRVGVKGVPRATTTLEQACPQSGKVGSSMLIAGVLNGAPAATLIQVTFTPPNGGSPIVLRMRTGPVGQWFARVTPEAGQEGIWTVRSTYEGNSEFAGSDAGPCEVLVGP